MRQSSNKRRGASWIFALNKIRTIDAVHFSKVAGPRQQHVSFYNAIPVGTGGLKNASEIIHHLLHLRGKIPNGQLAVAIKGRHS